MLEDFVSCIRTSLDRSIHDLNTVGDDLRQLLKTDRSSLGDIGRLHRGVAAGLIGCADDVDWPSVLAKYEDYQAEYGVPIVFAEHGTAIEKMCTYVYAVAETDWSTFGAMGEHGDDQHFAFIEWALRTLNPGSLIKAAEALIGYVPDNITDRDALVTILGMHSWADLFGALTASEQHGLYVSLGGSEAVEPLHFPVHLACAIYLTGISESFDYLDL